MRKFIQSISLSSGSLTILTMLLLCCPQTICAGTQSDSLTYRLSAETALGNDFCGALGVSSDVVTVAFSVKWDAQQNVMGSVDLRFTYDPQALVFVQGHFDSTAWVAAYSHILSPQIGEVDLLLNAGGTITTGSFQTLALIEFLPLCQNDAQTTVLTITESDDQNEITFGGLFDASPAGVQRLSGSVNVPATLRDPCCAVSGDVNGSGEFEIGDVTFLISRIFSNGMAPSCCGAADYNSDGSVNISDVTGAISRIFLGGLAPACGPTGISCQ